MSKSTKSISVVIPIYNEEKIVEGAINKCLEALEKDFEDYELIIVNDGSKDNTQQILHNSFSAHPRVVLLPNHVNLNQGISVQRGMAVANKEFVVHNGIDLPLKPVELREKLEVMADADMLVLQRKEYSGATTWRLITSNVNILIRKILFPVLTNGFKDMNFTQIYRRQIISQILPLAKSPAFTTPEMIMRAKYLGFKIITAEAEFQERPHGKGSLGKLHDILWTVYDMFRFRYLLWIGIDKHGKVK